MTTNRTRAVVALGAIGAGIAFPGVPAVADPFDGDNTWSDNHTVSLNNTGGNVAFWQHMTVSLLPACYEVTGSFGTTTRDATIWYQAAHGLTADGVVGPQTWTSAKEHLEYRYSDGPAAVFWFGWGVGHYQPGEEHYSGNEGTVARNMELATSAWKRYDAYGDNWYGTDHPGVGHDPYPLYCD